jgi:hypothetical protein
MRIEFFLFFGSAIWFIYCGILWRAAAGSDEPEYI